MAVKIEMVEREFVLATVAEMGIPARLQASGRTMDCTVAKVAKDHLTLAVEGDPSQLHVRESVSVYFDFRGQGVYFESRVLKAGPASVDLDLPPCMFRSLQRHWPRVRSPRGISVELILPDTGLGLACPESREWVEVERPRITTELDTGSLELLVESFKSLAALVADEGRVVMYKGREPVDIAEETAARLGKILYFPDLQAPLAEAGEEEDQRLVSRESLEDYLGAGGLAEGTIFGDYLAAKAEEGLSSALWCPVSYYRYTIGMVLLSGSAGKALGLEAVNLAWDFSRTLAWFLKRHGYFAAMEEARKRGSGAVVDASPSGVLISLPAEGPGIKEGSTLRLALTHGKDNLLCDVRVARSYDEGKARYYGLAFRGLPEEVTSALARELYGGSVELAEGSGS